MRSWVKCHKLEDVSDLLIYDLIDFTPAGTLGHYKRQKNQNRPKSCQITSEGSLQPLQVHPISHS